VPAPVARRIPFEAVELRPGLVVRLLADEERPAHLAAVQATGLYGDAITTLEQWWNDPHVWPTVVAWRGQILQYDYFHLLPDRCVQAGLTLRPSRGRGQWFWSEMRRPVLEQLVGAGYRTMVSAIRADRRDWIETMKQLWQATETGTARDYRWVHLQYHLPTALAVAVPVVPQRRLSGWMWERDGVTVREASDAEVATDVPQHLAEHWIANPQRGDYVLGLLEAGVELDRGTVLVTEVTGQLEAVRMIRPHGLDGGGTVGAFVALTRTQSLRVAVEAGVCRWALAAGYSTLLTWVPDVMLRDPELAARLARTGWTQDRERRPGEESREFTLDVARALPGLSEGAP